MAWDQRVRAERYYSNINHSIDYASKLKFTGLSKTKKNRHTTIYQRNPISIVINGVNNSNYWGTPPNLTLCYGPETEKI